MKLLQRIFDFYLDASIHVAIAVVSLCEISSIVLKLSTNWVLLGFLFFSTIVCYNFIKYGVEAKKYLIVSNPYHKAIQIFSFLSFLAASYFFYYLNINVWITILVLGFLAALYAVPLLPNAKNLRSLGGMKIFLVALVWTGCTVLLPIIDYRLLISWDIVLQMAQRFLLVLILLLPFEIRDLAYDAPELKTIPQRIGVLRTKVLGYSLLLLNFSLEFFKDELQLQDVILTVVISALLIAVLYHTKRKQKLYFSSFYVESIPIWYLLLYLVVIA